MEKKALILGITGGAGAGKSMVLRYMRENYGAYLIICDEIGAKTDFDALEYALDSGVKLVCSCHAGTLDELKKRPAPARLIKDKVLSYAAFLGTGNSCGRLREFYKL